jgi:hypothetical protein
MDMSKVGLGLGDLVDKLCEAKESLLANEIVETASTVWHERDSARHLGVDYIVVQINIAGQIYATKRIKKKKIQAPRHMIGTIKSHVAS